MRSYDVTELVSFVEQPNGSMTVEPRTDRPPPRPSQPRPPSIAGYLTGRWYQGSDGHWIYESLR